MMQKEVVNRLIAKPGTKIYGRLSVIAQYYCNMVPLLEVPPCAFSPQPKVKSAVIRQIPFTQPPYPVNNIYLLSQITKEAFKLRRKTLRNSIGHIFSEKIMKELKIDPSLRAENVTVMQYCQLTNWLDQHQKINFIK